MSDGTGIEWTDATWNVVIGCDKVSRGCDHCYAIRTATRMTSNPNPKVSEPYAGTVKAGEWTGRVNLIEDRLTLPLRWRKPRRVFVNAQSDLFHKSVADEFVARVFAVMALAPQHTFQVLTKRPGRMRSLLGGWGIHNLVMDRFANDDDLYVRRALAAGGGQAWPLPNVWIGVSVEDQKSADLRIPILLDTPAAVRWLSCEPLLGPVNLPACRCLGVGSIAHGRHWPDTVCDQCRGSGSQIDWVVVGGESGPGARPMHPDWARSLRDQCAAANVPLLFKQWGEWAPDGELPYREIMTRVGKRNAGRELDGALHDAYPGGAS